MEALDGPQESIEEMRDAAQLRPAAEQPRFPYEYASQDPLTGWLLEVILVYYCLAARSLLQAGAGEATTGESTRWACWVGHWLAGRLRRGCRGCCWRYRLSGAGG